MGATHYTTTDMGLDDLDPYTQGIGEFEDFYRREYNTLVGISIAMTGSRDDGEDVVQEAMVRAFLHWRRIRHLRRPAAWCVRVVSNICRDHWRRRRRERRYLDSQRWDEPVRPGPSPEALDFWRAVRRLPERWRMVMVLFYAGDHTTAEVASILGVPEGTVRSDLSRARLALAKELEMR